MGTDSLSSGQSGRGVALTANFDPALRLIKEQNYTFKCIQGSVGKPEGRRPLGRPRRRWEDNIKMDFQEV
jgi:hypothetical protein